MASKDKKEKMAFDKFLKDLDNLINQLKKATSEGELSKMETNFSKLCKLQPSLTKEHYKGIVTTKKAEFIEIFDRKKAALDIVLSRREREQSVKETNEEHCQDETFRALQPILQHQAKKRELLLEFRERQLKFFREHIANLRDKAQDLSARGYFEAAQKADSLCNELSQYANQYVTDDNVTLASFQNSANRAIYQAHKVLDIHRGWKAVLENVLLAISTLGIGYLAAAAYKQSFFVLNPKTESAEMVDTLHEEINGLASLK